MKTKVKHPFFSIVTVVYNSATMIEGTIQSVITQTFDDFKYIIIDGGSTDGTIEIINRYRDKINIFISEKDGGIYPAMNKAIGLCTGTYTNFMNSGDAFYNDETLQTVFNYHQSVAAANVDIMYGKAVKISSYSSGFRYEIGKPLTSNSFFLSVAICHQTMFTKTSLFTEVGVYPMEYKIGSFYGWLGLYYNFRRSIDAIHFVPVRIAFYLDGGLSFKMKSTIQRERLTVSNRYFSLKYRAMNNFLYVIEIAKAYILPIMVRMGVLDSYRQLKYSLKGKAVTK